MEDNIGEKTNKELNIDTITLQQMLDNVVGKLKSQAVSDYQRKLDKQSHQFDVPFVFKQFVVFNTKASIIYLSLSQNPDANIYDFRVEANRMFVSPLVTSQKINTFMAVFTESLNTPTLFLYSQCIHSPGIYAII